MVRVRGATCLALVLFTAGCAFVTLPGKPAARPRAPNNSMEPAALANAEANAPESADPGVFGGVARFVSMAVIAAVFVAAAVPSAPAEAARSGGRMGGMGSAARMAPQPRAGGGRSGPNISVGVGPMFAPPVFSPFGGGLFGPSLFGPSILPVPVPFGGFGPSASDQMLQNQQRRDEGQMDSQSRQIEALQKEIAELKAKK